MWKVFRTDLVDLWLCSPVSSYGHGRSPITSEKYLYFLIIYKCVSMNSLMADLRPIIALNYRLQLVEEIGDDPFTLAWRSMHFLSALQICFLHDGLLLYAYIRTSMISKMCSTI